MNLSKYLSNDQQKSVILRSATIEIRSVVLSIDTIVKRYQCVGFSYSAFYVN